MTVKELIAQLQGLSEEQQQLSVWVYGCDCCSNVQAKTVGQAHITRLGGEFDIQAIVITSEDMVSNW